MTFSVKQSNIKHDLDGESVPVVHKDDSIPANACTSVDDKAGVENVDGTQNLDDSGDDEAGDDKDEDHVENDEDKDCKMAGGPVRLSIVLLYHSIFSVCLDSTTDVAMSVATYPSIATPPSGAHTPMCLSIATPPSIAHTPMCLSIATLPSVAVPPFQAVATPPHGAMLNASLSSTIPTAPKFQLFM